MLNECNEFSKLGEGLENPPLPSLTKGGGIACSCDDAKPHSVTHLFSYSLIHLFTFKKVAFTLAEVLITLGIIGVIAALTMPSIITHHQKQVTISRLKKAYSSLSQMVIQSYADNGAVSDFLTTDEVVDSEKSKKFFETYWLPYFNSPIVSKSTFYKNSLAFSGLNGSSPDTHVRTDYSCGKILFSTQDGTIYYVDVIKYEFDDHWNVISGPFYNDSQTVWVDINGIKGPNRFGRDVFRFFVDFHNNIVRPNCYDQTNFNETLSNGACAAAKIINDGWQIKDDYPW